MVVVVVDMVEVFCMQVIQNGTFARDQEFVLKFNCAKKKTDSTDGIDKFDELVLSYSLPTATCYCPKYKNISLFYIKFFMD